MLDGCGSGGCYGAYVALDMDKAALDVAGWPLVCDCCQGSGVPVGGDHDGWWNLCEECVVGGFGFRVT